MHGRHVQEELEVHNCYMASYSSTISKGVKMVKSKYGGENFIIE